jgi:hypothetical protein
MKKQVWLLEDLLLVPNSQNWGKRISRRPERIVYRRILTRFHFDDFCRQEFVNTHRRLHSKPVSAVLILFGVIRLVPQGFDDQSDQRIRKGIRR